MPEIEDMIFADSLPVNTKAMISRLNKILKENKTNSISSIKKKGEILKIRKLIWLMASQIQTQTKLRLGDEWKELLKLTPKT